MPFVMPSANSMEAAKVLIQLGDSIKKKNKWKFLFSFDARTSWALGERAGIGGFKIGAEVNKVHRFGVGTYFLKKPIIRGGVQPNGEAPPNATDTTSFNFTYSSLFYERVWYQSSRLSLSTALHYGNTSVSASHLLSDTLNANGGRIYQRYFQSSLPLIEISGVTNYKVLRWFAIGLGGGYRAILTRDSGTKRALNGAVFIFQAKVLFGTLYKLVVKKPINDGWDEQKY